ncbi:NAD-specific glutamate dehydrogenase [Acinetobacter baumannii]|nr:NAD-specific glutamate dehydrogenase [Acinetobacter baumannii]
MQDTVGIDVEGDFDLRHAARCRLDAVQVELAQRFVIAGALTLTLQHVDGNRRLVVFRSREHLAVLGRDRGVFGDQRRHHAAHGFDTQRQRGNVQQQNVFHITGQHAALYRSAHGNRFVRVHVFTRLFAEEVCNFLLHHWHTGLAAHQDHVLDVGNRQACVFQRHFQRLDGARHQIFNQRLEFGASHFDVHVFWTGRVCRDVRQVNVGLLSGRQFNLRFLGGFFQTLHRQRIVTQIDALIFLELFHQVVDQTAVEVFAAQVGVTVGRQHFEGFFAVNVVDFDDGDIESTAAQVINRDGAVADFFVQAVGQGRRGRFVDDALDFQTRDAAGVFSRLTLGVVEVSRHGDNRFSDRFTQVIFRRFLHFLQHFRRDLRRSHFLAFHFQPGVAVVGFDDFVRHDRFVALRFFILEAAADQALDGEQGVFRVGHCLTLSRLANQSFTVLGICDNRRSGAVALGVFQHACLGTIHNCYARVGSTQVDTNNFAHLNVSTKKFISQSGC